MTEQAWFDWRRVVVAVFIGELVPILLLLTIVSVWGPTDASEAELFARRVGAWIGPIAGALTIFLVTVWAGAKSSQPVIQGALIGLTLATVDIAILAAAGEAFAWIFVASNGGKIMAGVAGGWIASRRVASRSAALL